MSINNKLGCSKPFIVLKKLRRAQAKKELLNLHLTVVLAKFKAKHLYCANTLLEIKKTINK